MTAHRLTKRRPGPRYAAAGRAAGAANGLPTLGAELTPRRTSVDNPVARLTTADGESALVAQLVVEAHS